MWNILKRIYIDVNTKHCFFPGREKRRTQNGTSASWGCGFVAPVRRTDRDHRSNGMTLIAILWFIVS
jgi:hypothetical protein